MSIKRIVMFFIVWSLSLSIFWCWNEENITVKFDAFSISLNNDFKEFNPKNIEGDWNSDKIINSLKRKNNNWYIENIIFSKSPNQNKLNTQMYASANIDKIKKQVIWYKTLETNHYEFSCNWDKIELIRNYFGISDNIFDKDSKIKYYVQQYYFQKNNYSYIISYTSDDKENIDIINWFVKKIKCE